MKLKLLILILSGRAIGEIKGYSKIKGSLYINEQSGLVIGYFGHIIIIEDPRT